MNFIVTKNKDFFIKIGNYNYLTIEELVLPEVLAFDSETSGFFFLQDDMFCFQIGTGKDNYLIDLQDYNTMFDSDLSYTFKDVKHILENKELVFHNANFDLTFLYKHNFYPNKVWDTFLASKILHNGEHASFRHDFGSVMEREIDVVYDKSEQKNIHKTRISTPKSIQYCFNDVDRLLELHDNLVNKLKSFGAYDAYVSNCEFIKALAYMETCGLPISKQKWYDKMQEDLKNSKNAQNKIIEYIYHNLPKFRQNQLSLFETDKKVKVMLSSAKQMIPVFKELGIAVLDDEGKESIQENVINKSEHDFVKLWLNYKEAEHRVTTFGQGILDKVIDNRIYSRFNPIVDTNRISSRKGEINFLNFPADKYTRECFEANKGFAMIVADYEGQENSTGADWTGDETMIKSILDNSDLHCAFARVLFPEIKDLSDDEIKKNHKDKRNYSKAPRFLFSYGGSAYTLHIQNNIPMEKALEIEKAYKELHKGIYEFGDKKLAESVKLGYVESCEGFKLKFPFFDKYQELGKQIENFSMDDWDMYKQGKEENKLYVKSKEIENTEVYNIKNKEAHKFYLNNRSFISEFFKLKSSYMRLCLNNPSQAKAAFQTKRAVSKLFDYIKSRNHVGLIKICNVPYDEIVLEVKENLIEEYKEKLAYFMVNEGNYYLTNSKLFMRAEANSGISWGKAK